MNFTRVNSFLAAHCVVPSLVLRFKEGQGLDESPPTALPLLGFLLP